MAGNVGQDLVAALRARIADDRATVSAFSLSVTGEAKSALLDVSKGSFRVIVEGGATVPSINWSLSLPLYSTVGRLISALQRAKGMSVTLVGSYVAEHPSNDLTVEGLPQLSAGNGAMLKHRMFADGELERMLLEAVNLHNPNYPNLSAVPHVERSYVLLKAAAIAYRTIAADTVRRKAIDGEAKTYLSLAEDVEQQYDRDAKRQHRIIPSAKADESKMGTGDIVQGYLIRPSLRGNGGVVPARRANPPTPPKLYDFADNDVEDLQVRVRWSQFRDEDFGHYELWRDTRPQVERSLAGCMGDTLSNDETEFLGQTAQQVLGGRTSNQRVDQSAFVDASALVEPETTYYYRLFLFSKNGEIAASDVKSCTTKPLRAKVLRRADGTPDPAAISVRQGPIAGGTAITVTGTDFTTGMTATLGTKPVVLTYVNPTTITFTTPAFANPAVKGKALDFVLRSVSGLEDVLPQVWTYQ